MKSTTLNQKYLAERLGIFLFSCFYLFIFNVKLPHGDALRIVRQIEANELLWNPNHLLLDPLGFLWYGLSNKLGFDISPLASFEIISAVSAIISLLIFHAILVAAGIKGRVLRIAAVAALFASKNFLSLAVTQYYFMIQMPFLLLALYCCVQYLSPEEDNTKRTRYLYFIGFLLSIATGFEVNNVLLVFLLGIILPLSFKNEFQWDWKVSARLWGISALIGFPLFILGYKLSIHNEGGFFSWLLSYAGANDDAMKQMYGMKLGLKSIAISGATVIYNLFFGSILETAGMGTVLKSLVFQEPLEFLPGTSKMLLSFLLFPVIGGAQLLLFIWAVKNIKTDSKLLLLLTWIFAYVIFAFFWNNGGNIFWFQSLPAVFLLFALYLSHCQHGLNKVSETIKCVWSQRIYMPVVVLLIGLNTVNTVFPVTFVDLEKSMAEHNMMLHENDLEIVPGWDKYKWMVVNPEKSHATRLMLMNMVTKPKDDQLHISRLKEIVTNHLNKGYRVIIGRVYDLDSELRPWSGLSTMGWSRVKIQSMLSEFCNRELTKINDVTFRELYICNKETVEHG